jgi:hypothetical protein
MAELIKSRRTQTRGSLATFMRPSWRTLVVPLMELLAQTHHKRERINARQLYRRSTDRQPIPASKGGVIPRAAAFPAANPEM